MVLPRLTAEEPGNGGHMDFPTESSLLSAIGRLRAIRKRRMEIRKEDAALEAEEAEQQLN